MYEIILKSILNKVPIRVPTKTRMDGRFFLSYSHRKGIIILNFTAGMIYELCDGHKDVGEIICEMQNMYPRVENQKIVDDIVKCICELERKDLITLKINHVYSEGNDEKV